MSQVPLLSPVKPTRLQRDIFKSDAYRISVVRLRHIAMANCHKRSRPTHFTNSSSCGLEPL